MLATFVWTVFGALSFSLVSAQSVCNSSPYDSLACLTSDQAASTVCASAPVQTLTITVTTTTLNPIVYSTTQHAASQTTVDVTSIQWSTVTVTAGPTSTITSMITETRTVNTTLTTYISPTEAARLETATASDPICHSEKAVSALGSLSSGKLATACSCIGNPVKTKTVTTIITAAAVASKTTEIAGTAKTTTLYKIDISTTTKTIAPSTLVTDTTILRTTLTTTKCYALPTFTQVWGPKAGCTDVAHNETLSLNSTVTNFYNATEECQGLCAQDSTCSFLYVEGLSTEGSRGQQTQYQCAFSDHAFNATTDIACDDHEKFGGSGGFAVGYDALDRGTEEI